MPTQQQERLLLNALAARTLILETFTGADNTPLTAHTPDINVPGGSWAAVVGSGLKILSDGAVKAGAAGTYDKSKITGAANCTITVDVIYVFDVGGQEVIIAFRDTDNSNYWWFELWSNTTLNLYENTAGGILRGTVAMALSAQTYAIKVVLSNNNISCYLNGVLKISYSSSVRASVTGVSLGNVASPNTKFDNYKVTVP